MRRKVIKQGLSTLTLSLPASWIRKHGIQPGDEIEMADYGESLLVSKGTVRFEKKTEVNVRGMRNKLILRYLNTLYAQGFDEIAVSFDGPEQMQTIHSAMQYLIGYTVVEQRDKSCLIRAVVDTHKEDFDKILKRLFYMIESLTQESIIALKDRNWDGMSRIKPRDLDVNKLAFLCLRILNKGDHLEPQKTLPLRDLVLILENTSDEYSNLTEELYNRKVPVSKETVVMLTRISDFVPEFERLFYKFDIETFGELHEKCRTVRFDILKAAKSVSKGDFIALYHARKISEWLLNAMETLIVLNATTSA